MSEKVQNSPREPSARSASGSRLAPGTAPPAESLWDRIKRHKVVEWTLAYVAFAYALLHGVQMLREAFEWPLLVPRLTVVVLLVGIPVAVTLAWYHGHRAQNRVSGVELSILVALFVAAGTTLWWVSRYSRAHTIHVAEIEAAHVSPLVGDKSIAVLPFLDMSEKHDQEYFADGMAEETLNQLAKLPGLEVIGRTSSFQFKGKADDLRTVGAALGAAYVLEGSVRRSGSHLRVTAQLIESSSGAHRWSQTFDETGADALQIQDEIALGLARALQIEITSSAPQRMTPNNFEAYETFLRGLHAREQFNRPGMEEAIADFKQALELDPQLTSAAEQLALTQWDMTAWGFVLPDPAYREARAAAQRALTLNSKSGIAHGVLCELYTKYDWDWVSARHECDVAREIAPHTSYVLNVAAHLEMALGNLDAASEYIEAAIAADPLDPRVIETSGQVSVRARRESDAELAFRRLIAIAPTYVFAHCELAMVLVDTGRAEEALAEAMKETESAERLVGLAIVNHAMNRTQAAEQALTELQVEAQHLWPMSIAEASAVLEHTDRAFEWLNRAYEEKDSTLYWIRGDPLLLSLEGDPRYKAFLQKMKLPE